MFEKNSLYRALWCRVKGIHVYTSMTDNSGRTLSPWAAYAVKLPVHFYKKNPFNGSHCKAINWIFVVNLKL